MTYKWTSICPARSAVILLLVSTLMLSSMPQIDHRVGESLERVVDLAQVLEAKQKAAELVLPGKDTFDGPKALLEDGRI
jgi:hypothetical protein